MAGSLSALRARLERKSRPGLESHPSATSNRPTRDRVSLSLCARLSLQKDRGLSSAQHSLQPAGEEDLPEHHTVRGSGRGVGSIQKGRHAHASEVRSKQTLTWDSCRSRAQGALTQREPDILSITTSSDDLHILVTSDANAERSSSRQDRDDDRSAAPLAEWPASSRAAVRHGRFKRSGFRNRINYYNLYTR